VVLTQITLSSGRSIELEKAFYKRIADNLQLCGIGLSSAQSGTFTAWLSARGVGRRRAAIDTDSIRVDLRQQTLRSFHPPSITQQCDAP